MVAVPGATPVTIPVAGSIVATSGTLLDHVPPAVASVRSVVPVPQTNVEPDMEKGIGLTVTTALLRQPPDMEYVIAAVPGARPVARPAELPIAAIVGFPLVQLPPVVASASVVVYPWQKLSEPVIAATVEATVTIIVDEQVVPIDV